MKIYEKWWFKLLLNAVLSVGLFFILVLSLGTSDENGAIFFGSLTFPAQFLFFLSFDTLGKFENGFAEVLRYALLVIGGLAILAFGIVCSVLFGFYKEIGSPWLYSFYVTGLLNGIIAYIFYYMINKCKLSNILYAFVPLASLTASYFLNVIFIYLGSGVHSFFYAHFGLIIGLIATVIMIILIKINHGIEFNGIAKRRAQEGQNRRKEENNGSGYDNNDNMNEPLADTRISAPPGLWNNMLEKAVIKATNSIKTGYIDGYTYEGQYGEVNNLKFEQIVLCNDIKVIADFDYKATSTQSYINSNDYLNDIKELRDEVEAVATEKISEAIRQVKNTYKGFDDVGEPKIEVKCRNEDKFKY